jgi:hypothetical protein
MCLICVHIEKEKMTIKEARSALGEMREKIGPEHYEEVNEMLTTKEWEEHGLTVEADGWITIYNSLDYVGSD